jgi:integrase
MSKWFKCKTTGVRYRQHPTRKHGVNYDRYFTIRYKVDGKEKSEGLGWASEGWTEKQAAASLAELKANHTKGEGPRSLAEKREIRQQAEIEAAIRQQEEKDRNITFGEIFTEKYYPHVQHDRGNQRSIEREEDLYRLWIAPVLADRPMREIMPIHLEGIKKNMAKAGRAARTIQYCLAVVRQTFNYAIKNKLFDGKNPAAATGGVKRPKVDNRRTRFLSRQEAADLLKELSKKAPNIHDISFFALYTGARAGEVFNLKWGDVDLFQGVAMLKDTKSGKNRAVYLIKDLKDMLARKRPKNAQGAALVFSGRKGVKITRISNSFARAVAELRLNEGVTDPRQKVTFHTLRHTFASWLAIDGVNPFHLKELLGHSDLKLTERYSHLSESALKEAALRISQA